MVLAFTLIACGNNANSVANNDNNNDIVNVANDEENVTNDVEVEEVAEEAEAEETEMADEDEFSLDQSLMGMDLLMSIAEAKAPSKLVMTSESMMMGSKTVTTTYTEGDKTRSEVRMAELGTMFTISLNGGEEIYYWEEGATEGTLIKGMSADEASELGYLQDDTELFAEVTDESSPDMVARVEMLDGEEVIYIETTENDPESGEVEVFMWYSVKYATPLKYEMYMGGEDPIVSYVVTDIDKKMNIDNSMFTPPSDVNFMEVDMGAMMDMDMMDMDMFDDMD
jgi:outer membrane lipoprotein-sorting protein